MKKWIYPLFVFSALNFNGALEQTYLTHVAEPTTPRNIQILLEKDAAEVLLEVKGPYYLLNPHDGSRVASGLQQASARASDKRGLCSGRQTLSVGPLARIQPDRQTRSKRIGHRYTKIQHKKSSLEAH